VQTGDTAIARVAPIFFGCKVSLPLHRKLRRLSYSAGRPPVRTFAPLGQPKHLSWFKNQRIRLLGFLGFLIAHSAHATQDTPTPGLRMSTKDFLRRFEEIIVHILIGMMIIVIFLATVELGWIIIRDILRPPLFMLEIRDLVEIFGFFLLVLIGIELLETIKAYLIENIIHVDIVIEVALIAIARKIIILDLDKYDGVTLVGIAAIIFSITFAFFAIRRRRSPNLG
jgi:uncharacterized membrane protein (DUF373 family)